MNATAVEVLNAEFEAARAACAEAHAVLDQALAPLRDPPALDPEQSDALDAAEELYRARSRRFEAVFLVWRAARRASKGRMGGAPAASRAL